MDTRKCLRVKLQKNKEADFDKAKTRFESLLMCELSDAQFASKLLHWAIEQHAKQS